MLDAVFFFFHDRADGVPEDISGAYQTAFLQR